MIDINRLKKELNKYINEFDINDPQIEMKIRHTYRVSSLSRQLATHLRLSDEDVDLAEAIGLLHDIGKSIDHELEGSQVTIGVDLCRKYKENATVITHLLIKIVLIMES